MYGYTSTSLYGDDGDNGKMDRNEKLSLRVKTEPKISKDSGGYGGYAGDRDVDGLDEYRYRNESIGSYKQYDKYYNMESDRYNGKESSQYNTNMNTTTNTKINPSNNNPNPNPS